MEGLRAQDCQEICFFPGKVFLMVFILQTVKVTVFIVLTLSFFSFKFFLITVDIQYYLILVPGAQWLGIYITNKSSIMHSYYNSIACIPHTVL